MEALLGVLLVVGIGAGVIPLFYVLSGIIVVQPFTQVVVLRFGKYRRTITSEGLGYVFPLGRRLYRFSSQAVTVTLPRMVVVEAQGTPIEVSAVCVYRLREARCAALEVENYENFVRALASVVVKNVCSQYPYESADPNRPCLKKEDESVRQRLIHTLIGLLQPTGVDILDFRLNDLAYTAEIAQAMLLRQQAAAMVDARRTVVDGAVETVRSALVRLHQVGLPLPPTEMEDFALKLMLVLCSGERLHTMMPIEVQGGTGP